MTTPANPSGGSADDQTASGDKPTVYFLCNTNCGKSQMAEGLMRLRAGESVNALSAGITPGDEVNAESAESLARLGADMSGGTPTAIDPAILRAADRVIVVGGADVRPVEGMAATIERWEVDEPSKRGIRGDERMDLIRDDIDARVRELTAELSDDNPTDN